MLSTAGSSLCSKFPLCPRSSCRPSSSACTCISAAVSWHLLRASTGGDRHCIGEADPSLDVTLTVCSFDASGLEGRGYLNLHLAAKVRSGWESWKRARKGCNTVPYNTVPMCPSTLRDHPLRCVLLLGFCMRSLCFGALCGLFRRASLRFFLGMQTLVALREIHSRGRVHLDVKPANLLYGRIDAIKLGIPSPSAQAVLNLHSSAANVSPIACSIPALLITANTPPAAPTQHKPPPHHNWSRAPPPPQYRGFVPTPPPAQRKSGVHPKGSWFGSHVRGCAVFYSQHCFEIHTRARCNVTPRPDVQI